jgi:hypothetical protein
MQWPAWAHQNVSHVIHFELEPLPYPSNGVVRGRVAHRIVESGHSDPESVESVVRSVDGEHGRSGVRFGHSSVPL